jgi:hypothetical protein
MKAAAILFLAATTLAAQDKASRPNEQPMLASIRSVDSSATPTIRVSMGGRIFKSLGVEGQTGSVKLDGNSGTAMGVLSAELTADVGEMSFSVPVFGPELELVVWPRSGASAPRFHARGHTVRVYRDRSGVLGVKTGL